MKPSFNLLLSVAFDHSSLETFHLLPGHFIHRFHSYYHPGFSFSLLFLLALPQLPNLETSRKIRAQSSKYFSFFNHRLSICDHQRHSFQFIFWSLLGFTSPLILSLVSPTVNQCFYIYNMHLKYNVSKILLFTSSLKIPIDDNGR